MSELTVPLVAAAHPVRLRITDDLRRTRLTVAFRLILVIPHFLWGALLAIVAVFAVIANWFATLATARSPDGLHNFLAGLLRYATHVSAYLFLIADPYPRFFLIQEAAPYPVDLELDPPVTQNRWTVAFRLVLAIPALIVTNILNDLSMILAIFSWVMGLVQARVPEGIRNFSALALRYQTQTYAYVMLLTSRYPNFGVNITA
jgi:hypothetical protein